MSLEIGRYFPYSQHFTTQSEQGVKKSKKSIKEEGGIIAKRWEHCCVECGLTIDSVVQNFFFSRGTN